MSSVHAIGTTAIVDCTTVNDRDALVYTALQTMAVSVIVMGSALAERADIAIESNANAALRQYMLAKCPSQLAPDAKSAEEIYYCRING